ncbi:MAG TPA: hypothetical protein VKM55_14010 [Candidatus Lokiarchaeia archaeon]|nr:hypothetical protein [Candidatus Lokiarchaeia archaeon]
MMTKTLSFICPTCRNQVYFHINEHFITSATKYPIPVSIKHCMKVLTVYIDANFKIRGIESAFDLYDVNDLDSAEHSLRSSNLSANNDHITYASKMEDDEIVYDNIQDLIEKKLLQNIFEKKRIDINALVTLIKEHFDPFNTSIDLHALIKRKLEKYIINGLILEQKMWEPM